MYFYGLQGLELGAFRSKPCGALKTWMLGGLRKSAYYLGLMGLLMDDSGAAYG